MTTDTFTRFLICLDVDGTVLGEDGSLSQRVRDAVATARSDGHAVTLATGRNWEATFPILEMLGLEPEYVVCANGALIMRRIKPGEVVPEHENGAAHGYRQYAVEVFDPTEVLTLIHDYLPDASYLVENAFGHRRYTRGMDDWNLEGAEEVSFEGLMVEPVMRVVVQSPDHTEEDFLRLVEGIGLKHVTYAIGWTSWLDIAPFGVSKATALERVRQAMQYSLSEVIVVGDGRNDIEMMEWASRGGGVGVAMGQAPDVVKAAASQVTGSVEDDGLAVFLEELPGASGPRS
ncbi:MAG TPA: HAD family phosphatase [Pseudoclavibacter sp.]|nr:HAD family phosphatase [Pseudoclavibacter sp.]